MSFGQHSRTRIPVDIEELKSDFIVFFLGLDVLKPGFWASKVPFFIPPKCPKPPKIAPLEVMQNGASKNQKPLSIHIPPKKYEQITQGGYFGRFVSADLAIFDPVSQKRQQIHLHQSKVQTKPQKKWVNQKNVLRFENISRFVISSLI